MTTAEQIDLTVFIAKYGHRLMTDSPAVAIAFGRTHKNVMRAIEALHASQEPEIAEHARLNFEPMTYRDIYGRERRAFRMTCEGMVLSSPRLAGNKSRLVRILFVDAFEAVAKQLADRERSLMQRLHDLARREAPSEVKGKIGSRLMN